MNSRTSMSDGCGGLGLGRALMTALIAAAKQRGLREMEGFVLSRNKPMLKLAERLGFTISPDPEDAAVKICHLRLVDEPHAGS
jgi:acetyltransferase